MFKKLLPLVAEDRTQNADKAHNNRIDRLEKDGDANTLDNEGSESDDGDLEMDDNLFM